MEILMLQLLHTKHWVIFAASIYTLNCENTIFSKCGRHSMLLSLLHCIYIWMKKSIYSRLTSNLLISFVILPTQKRIVFERIYVLSNIICHFITCKLSSRFVYFLLISSSIYLFGNQVSDVEIPYKPLNTFLCILNFIRSSWRNVTRRRMVYKHCKPIVCFCSALYFPFS